MATSTARVSCAYWEWQRDDGGFSPFTPEVSNQIETASANGQSSVILARHTVDLIRMVQKNNISGFERLINRVSLKLKPNQTTAYWTWAVSHGQYVPYDIKASILIEEQFNKQVPNIDLSQTRLRLPYSIDFTAMIQTRHLYNTRRSIHRQSLPIGQTIEQLLAVPMKSVSYNHISPKAYAPVGVVSKPTNPPTANHTRTSTAGANVVSYAAGPNPSTVVTTGTTRNTKSSPSVSIAASNSNYKSSYSKKSVPQKSSGYSSAAPSRIKPAKLTVKQESSLGRKTSGANNSKQKTSKRSVPKVRGLSDRFAPYVKVVSWVKASEDEPCPICMNNLTEESGFADNPAATSGASVPQLDVVKLRKCPHKLHRPCLLSYIESTATEAGFQCPTCKKTYGVKRGDMPPGTMTVTTQGTSLPGHEAYNTIVITYNFRSGTQNGKRYSASTFPRTCYLPGSPEGRKVLDLLKIAWERRLTFTIGTSVTSGVTDTVVWNEIHHKTSISNHGGHGYPDPNYLDNVTMELAAQGVVECGCGSVECRCEESGDDSDDDPIVISDDDDL